MEGAVYIDMPVDNAIRSTATPGTIKVTISAPGLQSAQVVLRSAAPGEDAAEDITEPRLADAGRLRMTRLAGFQAVAAARTSTKNTIADIPQVRAEIEKFGQERNLKTNLSTCGQDRHPGSVIERQGRLIADGYNFNAHRANVPGSAEVSCQPKKARPGCTAAARRIKKQTRESCYSLIVGHETVMNETFWVLATDRAAAFADPVDRVAFDRVSRPHLLISQGRPTRVIEMV